ncbi:DUF4062 domain-containing protein [Geodermatophilus sp. URMC 63]
MARRVLDIFLSSTSVNLREHRSTVTDVLSQMGQFAVWMETFGARPNKPLDTCREEVEACDALIVLVGHRYGWVPSETDGGDGKRSITWFEVQWALDAGRPVYAFLADPTRRGPTPANRTVSSPRQRRRRASACGAPSAGSWSSERSSTGMSHERCSGRPTTLRAWSRRACSHGCSRTLAPCVHLLRRTGPMRRTGRPPPASPRTGHRRGAGRATS